MALWIGILYVIMVALVPFASAAEPVSIAVSFDQVEQTIDPQTVSVAGGFGQGVHYLAPAQNLFAAGVAPPVYRYQTHLSEPSPEEGVWDFTALDHVIDFALQTGAEPVLSISGKTAWMADPEAPEGTWRPRCTEEFADYSARIVEHYNIDRGTPIRLWEIGNEKDGQQWPTHVYIEVYQAVAEKMLAVDPTIQLAGPVTCNPNLYWARHLLLNAADAVNALSYHQYGSAGPFENTDTDTLMASTVNYRTQAEAHRQLNEELVPDRRLPILITETNTNPSFSGTTDPRIRTQVGAAWYVAALTQFVKGGGDVFCWFTFDGGFGMVWGETLYPAFHAAWMLRSNFHGNLTEATVSGAGAESVQAAAFASSAHQGLVLVNTSDRTVPVEVQLPLDDYAGLVHYVLNDQTYASVRTVTEGQVPLITPRWAPLDGATYAFEMEPYEVRVQRFLRDDQGVSLSLSAVQDNYIDGAAPDVVQADDGSGPILRLRAAGGAPWTRKMYITFDVSDYLSALSQHEDENVTATLTLTYAGSTGGMNQRLRLFILKSGFEPDPGNLGADWEESEITWNNAPGNDVASAISFTGDFQFLHQAEYADTESLTEGDRVHLDLPLGTLGALTDYLQHDNTITLALASYFTDHTSHWASRENPTYDGPTLTLLAPEPEPGTVLLKVDVDTDCLLDLAGGVTNPGGYIWYPENTLVSAVALPRPGYVFTGWSGDVISSDNPLETFLSVDTAITAEFGPDPADPDGDGLSNYEEIVIYGTDPDAWDSTGDGLGDGEIVAAGADPAVHLGGIICIIQDRPEEFDLYDDASIHELSMGGFIVKAGNEGAVDLRFRIEESIDLETWLLYEDFLRQIIPVGSRVFLRVRDKALEEDK